MFFGINISRLLLEDRNMQTKRQMGANMAEMNEKYSDSLVQRLKKWEEAGIRLYMDGTPASSESIEQNCVREIGRAHV